MSAAEPPPTTETTSGDEHFALVRAQELAEWILSFRDDETTNEGYGVFYVRGDKLGKTDHDAAAYWLPTHPFEDSPFKTDLRMLAAEFLAAVRGRVLAAERAERDEAQAQSFGEAHARRHRDWLEATAQLRQAREALCEAEEEILYVLDEFNRGDVKDAEEGARVARKIIRTALESLGDAAVLEQQDDGGQTTSEATSEEVASSGGTSTDPGGHDA